MKMEVPFGIIYRAVLTTNGRKYYGKTQKSLVIRKAKHLRDAKNGSKNHFHRALIKHGLENFMWEEVETCFSLDELNQREKFWIAHDQTRSDQNGFNITSGGDGGFVWSADAKERVSQAVKEAMWRPEVRERFLAGKAASFQKESTHINMAEAARRRPERSAETNAAISASHRKLWESYTLNERAQRLNAMHKANTSAKRSATMKARYEDPEERRKTSERAKASHARPEVRQRLSESIRKGHAKPEVRARKSEIMKERWASPEFRESQSSRIRDSAWINRAGARRRVPVGDVAQFLVEGWVRGRGPNGVRK